MEMGNKAKNIKAMWVEIVFAVIILFIIIASLKNMFSVMGINGNISKDVFPKSSISLSVEPLVDYLSNIKELENCTAIFTVKDIQGFSLTQEHVDGLKKLGFDSVDRLLEHEYHNFIGIYSKGEVLYQYIGDDEASVYRCNINNHYVVIKSETLHAGNKAIVYIDNIACATNVRGINIVILDNNTDTLIDSIGFDTHKKEIPAYRLEDGNVVLVSDRTEGENNE